MNYEALKSGCDQLFGVYSGQQDVVRNLLQEIEALEKEVSILTFSSAALATLMQSVSVESLVSVEKLVTYGLRTTVDDQTLQFGLDVITKRGVPWVDPFLVQNGVKANILDAFGGGPASIVAFLLRVLVCRRLKLAPVILLDETFSFLSTEYVDNAAKLLREIADKLGLTIILVTHQHEFLKQATLKYQAVETSKGTVFKPVQAHTGNS